jgi:hypothetical protein
MGRIPTDGPTVTTSERGDAALDRALGALGALSPADHVDDGLLSAFDRGSLDRAATARIEAHLAGCESCRALLAARAAGPSPALLARAEQALLAARPATADRWSAPRLAGLGGLVAVAAAALLVVAWPGGGAGPLPAYEVSAPLGGVKAERGEETASNLFVADSRVRLDLRPSAPLEGPPPAVAVFVARPGGAQRPAPAETLVRGSGGMVRFEADAGALFGTAEGAWSLFVVLGADTGALADLADRRELRRADLERLDGDELRWYERQIEYRRGLE